MSALPHPVHAAPKRVECARHPALQQADDDLALPSWWPAAAVAVLAAVWLFSWLQPWGFARALP